VLEVYRVMCQAVARARRGEGATLIEAKLYRLVPHSSDDDDRTYRSREEVEMWKQREPLVMMQKYLQSVGLLDETRIPAYEARARQIVDDANEFARQAPYPQPESALTNVWGKLPTILGAT